MDKKALIVANTGGFFAFLLNDIDLLQSRGYRVSVAANGKNHNWEDTRQALEQRGLTLRQVDFDGRSPLSKSNLTAYRQIRQLLKQEQFDLIHCHTPVVGLLTRLAARQQRKKGARVYYTTHGFAFTRYSSLKERLIYRSIEWLGSCFCDGIITINREDYASAQKLRCKNVIYIPGVGLDVDKYSQVRLDRQALRKTLRVEEDQLLVLAVGELCRRKNHRVIIDALARLENKDRYVFMLCGSDSGLAEQLRQQAKQLGVDLRLMGFRHDIPQLMHCADIGVIPSLREGLGMAGLQSLCAGVPLAGSRVQGICDYIEEGKTGFLCHPTSPEEFAQAIRKLSDPALRRQMAPQCRQMAEAFRKEHAMAILEALYFTEGTN